ncbi:dipeptidase [Radiobacillus deserti]|uniref:Membrane dipeptidase n=1 Tax=Radiobacillus deserti TaxID=2594883 RepID=A0A516KKB3_9BACI|nr:dipeptidase [Radiobacillus deserti]QDP41834.1 membrane dipeptidase [Radiobacillus deserti]
MKLIDTHCDALLKLQLTKRLHMVNQTDLLSYQHDPKLDTNLERLKQGKVAAQFYAIFVEPDLPDNEKWQHALEQIDFFYNDVLPSPGMVHIREWNQLHDLKEGEIGAVLTLEGADAFGNDLTKLRTLYRLGVKSVGLTWNNANLCADGVGEPRGGGLTLLGKDVVKLNNEHRVFTDVSHLSIKGFWDVMDLADYPLASHSNARALCDHVRNLYDEQITAMFQNNGLIHVVFNPPFIKEDGTTTISDLIKHIDHMCALGGVKQIGFGSDFDGIGQFVEGLNHAGEYQNLINELMKHYKEEEVRGFAYENFLNHLPQ